MRYSRPRPRQCRYPSALTKMAQCPYWFFQIAHRVSPLVTRRGDRKTARRVDSMGIERLEGGVRSALDNAVVPGQQAAIRTPCTNRSEVHQ